MAPLLQNNWAEESSDICHKKSIQLKTHAEHIRKAKIYNWHMTETTGSIPLRRHAYVVLLRKVIQTVKHRHEAKMNRKKIIK